MPITTNIEVQNLLREVAVYLNAKKLVKSNYESRLADDFSPIELLSLNEPDISKVLAYLLDPKASHAQGTLFLDEFCNTVQKLSPISEASESNPLPESFRLTSDTMVSTEVADSKSGRMDILLWDSKNALCIENKPWASDQDGQLWRYGQELQDKGFQNWLLIYLCDHEPTKNSTQKDEKILKHTVQLSFSLMATILLTAAHKAQALNVRYFVEIFAKYLKQNIAGEPKMTDNQIEQLIKDNINSAKVISEAYERQSKTSWNNFCTVLEKQCQQKYNGSVVFEKRVDIHTLRTRCHFRFKPTNRNWYISFEKRHPSRLRDFYWGINVNGEVNETERAHITSAMNELFKASDTPERWWPWWVWGKEGTDTVPTDLAFFPLNLDEQKWMDAMSSQDGGELAKIVWCILDRIMQAIKAGRL